MCYTVKNRKGMMMKRITIRNLRSPKSAKPRVFDLLVDDDEVYFEVKAKNNENEVIALADVMKQALLFRNSGLQA